MWGALFPGQGSQSVGMGKFLFDEFKTARHLFEEASDALRLDMKKLCFEGPDSELQLTENTQPALVLVSTVSAKVANEVAGLKVSGASGHSVGEYSALVHAEVLGFSDALIAVRTRGHAMQKAVPVGKGGMCAVLGLQDELVRALCQEVEKDSGEPLDAANFNSPGQVVVSGSQKAIDWMKEHVTAEWVTEKLTRKLGEAPGRLKLIPLKVSAPFHSRLMKPAQDEMELVLKGFPFRKGLFPVVQNLTAKALDPHQEDSPNLIRENLIGQISGAVLWTQCQEELINQGITHYVELGAGKVLQGLGKKIAGDKIKIFGMNSIDDLKILEREIH